MRRHATVTTRLVRVAAEANAWFHLRSNTGPHSLLDMPWLQKAPTHATLNRLNTQAEQPKTAAPVHGRRSLQTPSTYPAPIDVRLPACRAFTPGPMTRDLRSTGKPLADPYAHNPSPALTQRAAFALRGHRGCVTNKNRRHPPASPAQLRVPIAAHAHRGRAPPAGYVQEAVVWTRAPRAPYTNQARSAG